MEARGRQEEVFETEDVVAELGGGAAYYHSHEDPAALEERLRDDPEHVVPTPLDADAAFEVFHGRRFETRDLPDLSGSIAAPAGMAAASRPRGVVLVEETPVQRYLRLKAEASELEEEVAALAAAKKTTPREEGEEGGEEREEGSAMLWRQLAGEVEGLRAQLLGLGGSVTSGGAEEEGGITSIAAAAAEANLAEALLRRVGALGLGEKGERTGNGNCKRSTSSNNNNQGAAEAEAEAEQGPEVVYELYYRPSTASDGAAATIAASSSSSRASALQAVERRLAALEQAVLAAGGADQGLEGEEALVLAARTLPLAEAVAKVERQAALLDAGSVETLRQRLALLRGEWEDFRRERAKIMDRAATADDAHAQRVEALWEQARRLAPLAGDLPALVGRLQALQGLHAESMAFSQRLQRLEAGQEALTKLLQGASESLAGVKVSLRENVEAMAENVREVDARIAELLG